ncbi:Ger(x)C family spore germination protein [Bacillus sp. JJ722]|uniref:Ger(x)C family spore germination protein n=1 Tax=Bacillus sp. JJ722 TaxID=3122973 RepID=UPI003000ABCF
MKRIMLCIVSTIFLSGCWDSRNIEEISVLTGVGIDLSKKKNEIEFTAQTLIPSKTENLSLTYLNTTVTSKTVHNALRDVALSIKPVNSNHQRIVLLNEEVVKKDQIIVFLSQFLRDNDTRRSCLIFITKLPTIQILDYSKGSSVPSNDLFELQKNNFRTDKLLPSVTLGTVFNHLESDRNFAIQLVNLKENRLVLDGAAVMKKGKVIDNINTSEIQALNWIDGEVKGGIIEIRKNKQTLGVEILKELSRNVETTINKGQLSIHIDEKYTGRFSEGWDPKKKGDKKYINSIEKLAEKEVKKDVEKLINKMQKEYKTNISTLGEMVRIQHPEFWKENKKNWDKIFSSAKITFNLEMQIPDTGALR